MCPCALAPIDLTGDAFGKVYEYFLGNFAMKEGQKGGVFYTPESIVKLIVEIIEPYHGRILDPACGSGGTFVMSANFVERHGKTPSSEISIYPSLRHAWCAMSQPEQQVVDLDMPDGTFSLEVWRFERRLPRHVCFAKCTKGLC